MIRGAVRLALVGAGIGYALDRILAEQAGDEDPEPISSLVVIDAPIDRTWQVIADLERQPLWMHEMKAVRILSDGPIGVGTVCEADVRILGITVTDPVRITAFEPPHRYAISHDGTFRGSGTITLEEGPDGTTTIVRWDEVLIPPVFSHLGALAMAPVLGSIFQADLGHLKGLVESEVADDATEPKGPAAAAAVAAKPRRKRATTGSTPAKRPVRTRKPSGAGGSAAPATD